MKKDLQGRVESSSEIKKENNKQAETSDKIGVYILPLISYQMGNEYYIFVYNQFVGATRDKKELIDVMMRINCR